MQAGLEEAGKVASIVGEDLVDSVSSLVNNHIQVPYLSHVVLPDFITKQHQKLITV